MKRIVIVSNPVPKSNKSSQVSLNKLIKIVEPLCDETVVLSANLDSINCSNNTTVISKKRVKSNNRLLNYLFYIKFQISCFACALKEIKKKSIVLFWIADSMPLCMVAAKLKRAVSYYFIYGNVNKIDFSLTGKITAILIKMMANLSEYVCAENDAVFNEWSNCFNKKKKRVIHLYSDTIREPINDTQSNIIGMVCRVSKGKHVQETIDAFISIHREYPNWKLEIIGNGDCFEECQRMIVECKASNYIKMYGWISHDELIEIVQTWCASVLPSDSEGLPNTLLESMGVGTPCLATPVGAIPDIIIDGYNGWLLKGVNEDSIKNGLIRVICEKNKESIKQNAYSTILRRYSIEAARKNAANELGRVE